MSDTPPLGSLVHAFFVDHLITVKGLRPASVRSYRDTVRLLLVFVAADKHCKLSRLALADLTFARVLRFPPLPRSRAGQPHPHPQPAPRRAAHPLRVHRRARARDAPRLPAGGRHPDEAGGPTRDALPRT